jgi:pimeloyl-ACP methyl ester carboxylesterase
MLILRGVANSENPRGQLDDRSALEYARRIGFRGEVLDVAGNTSGDSVQVRTAVERIRRDETITAIYGFSGGGYNARLIWQELSAAERDRIRKVVVIGSPGVEQTDFVGSSDVVIKPDPPEGHMAGPEALLNTLQPEISKASR